MCACVGPWQLHSLAMAQFIHVVFSKGRADAVEQMRELVGDAIFKRTHWYVAHGDQSSYVDAGACLVQETGDLCHTVQCAIDLANAKKKPVAFMSDDVRGFYCKEGDPAVWPTWRGRQLAIGSFALKILQAMRLVGTPMGAVYHMAAARVQLAMPAFSYHHFCNLDFLVLDPPFPIQLRCDALVNMKVDYHLTASVLAAFGAVCRVNTLSIDAPHYRSGGAGTMEERYKSDKDAAKWLMKHWPPFEKQPVFRQNLQRKGNFQVIMDGKPLLNQCDRRLDKLHANLRTALAITKRNSREVRRAIKRKKQAPSQKRQRLAVGSLKDQWRLQKRAQRHTLVVGALRRVGRLAAGKAKMDLQARKQLSRARQRLRKVICELRRKRQVELRS